MSAATTAAATTGGAEATATTAATTAATTTGASTAATSLSGTTVQVMLPTFSTQFVTAPIQMTPLGSLTAMSAQDAGMTISNLFNSSQAHGQMAFGEIIASSPQLALQILNSNSTDILASLRSMSPQDLANMFLNYAFCVEKRRVFEKLLSFYF